MQQVKDSGKLQGPKKLTVTNTFSNLGMGGSSGPTKGPMNTNRGHHPAVKRISKHPMTSMTSRKGQQGQGAC